MVPEDYWDYYHKKGVQAIVRLNKKVSTLRCRACATDQHVVEYEQLFK